MVFNWRKLCPLSAMSLAALKSEALMMSIYTGTSVFNQQITPRCLFVFLALQPLFGCIFSQPRSGLLAASFTRFLDYTQRCATVGRTPLDE